MPSKQPIDADLIERAIELITADPPKTKGHRNREASGEHASRAAESPERREARMLRDAEIESTLFRFFAALGANDIRSALSELERAGVDHETAKHAVRTLAAYTRWVALSGATVTADGEPVEPLLARFATVVSYRLAGDAQDADSGSDDRSLLPQWTEPDVALGWTAPPHRVTNPEIEERGIEIAAAWVREKRFHEDRNRKLTTSKAEIEAAVARRFGVSPATIRAAIKTNMDYVQLFDAKPDLLEGFLPSRR